MTQSVMTFMTFAPLILVVAFSIQQSHLLMSLLALEGLMLSLVFILPTLMSLNTSSMTTLSIVILSMGACEASLGLALLVLMTRFFGSDLVKTSSI